MQTNTKKKDGNHKQPQGGTFAILKQILAREGIRGIYRGVGAPIIAVAPIWATSFWGFDTGIKLVRMIGNHPAELALTLPQLCLAGGFSALPTALIMVPAERIKCLLQMQQQDDDDEGSSSGRGKKRYNGTLDCAAQIYRDSGIRGLYKGTALTLMRDIPANIVYFGVYEIVKQSMASKVIVGGSSSSSLTLTALTAGAMAGIAFWPVALPMDTLKSRYQTAEDGHYNNMGDVYNEVVKEDGLGGLFKGIGPAMIRSAPANAISFLGAELTKKALSFIT
jgi:solute carrier family 25 carnitine/acylcarnitine transporter 20/29